jgi:acyl-coenzyme A thioesterase PaaI-like protein
MARSLTAAALKFPTCNMYRPAIDVHGGFAAMLVETCMGLAVHTTIERGFGSTTLVFKISLLRPITPRDGPDKS